MLMDAQRLLRKKASMLDDTTTAIVTWVGTIVSIGALVYSISQAHSARKSAQQAETASAQVKSALRSRLEFGRLSSLQSDISLLTHFIATANSTAIDVAFPPFRRNMIKAITHYEKSIGITKAAALKRALKAIGDHLNETRCGKKTIDPPLLHSKLQILTTFVDETESSETYDTGDKQNVQEKAA